MSSDSTEPTPGAGATTTEPGDQQAGRKPKSAKKRVYKQPSSSLWLNKRKGGLRKNKPLPKKGLLTKAKKTAQGENAETLIQKGQPQESIRDKRNKRALTEQKRQVDRLRLLKSLKSAPKVTKDISGEPKAEKGQKKKISADHIPKYPPVPESILRKRKYLAKIKKQHLSNLKKRKKERKEKRSVIYKRARQYLEEYKRRDRELITLRRMARNSGSFFREPEPKLAIVVRIRGINGVDPKTKSILRILRLRQIQNAVFVKLNASTLVLLRKVEPYIAWGTPNLKTVRELIYKRGHAKINGQRVTIYNNHLIEERLGRFNILCMEDLIHEIFTVGPYFKQVNNFLWPFKLSSPSGGYNKKTVHFVEGGDAGNREELINRLIRRMN